MRVQQVLPRASEQYPWIYRMDFGDTKLGRLWADIQPWTQQMEVPGVWVGSIFYTNEQGANIVALKWS